MNIHSSVTPPASKAKHPAKTGDAPASRDSVSGLATDKRRDVVSDKREAILGAALDLFVERGFYGTAVPDIADKAGVGAGTIYRYFESKEALVNELYRQEKQRFGELTIKEMPTGNLIARELFRTMWMRMAKFAIANPKPFVFMELHHHAPYLDAESHALEQRMNALFSSVVVAAQARGELKAGPPQLLMSIVMGAFVGVIRGCLETAAKLEDANWSFAEQCMWEAIRA
jgi:TetR/AcrR family transcriptional regulator, repressor of fatR-cypB operon